jgi:mRNA interferase HicA
MRYREVAARLTELGCTEVPRGRGGSHRTWLDPTGTHLATVPDAGSKDLKQGTLHAALRQLGLDWHCFLDARCVVELELAASSVVHTITIGADRDDPPC